MGNNQYLNWEGLQVYHKMLTDLIVSKSQDGCIIEGLTLTPDYKLILSYKQNEIQFTKEVDLSALNNEITWLEL